MDKNHDYVNAAKTVLLAIALNTLDEDCKVYTTGAGNLAILDRYSKYIGYIDFKNSCKIEYDN